MRALVMSSCLVVSTACGAGVPETPKPEAPKREAPAPAVVTDWRIIDVMPTWWAYWESARDKPLDEQVALFERDVVAKHPDLFSRQVVGRDPTAKLDLNGRVRTFLADVQPLLAPMKALSAAIESELPAHRQSFMRAFPEFAWDGEVYFTISLDAFDGAVREIDGEPKLLFGVDKIARIHGADASLAPLFHHELFHILHLVKSSPFDETRQNRMYQALWSEGLAVYVAHTLNPGASLRQLVLDDAMVEQGTRQLPALAKEMLDNIDSGDPIFYRDWFRGAGKREDIPNRVGYFLGFRVAQLMGKTRSLQQLAKLSDPELFGAIEAALRELATP